MKRGSETRRRFNEVLVSPKLGIPKPAIKLNFDVWNSKRDPNAHAWEKRERREREEKYKLTLKESGNHDWCPV